THAWEHCRISILIREAHMRELVNLAVLGLGHIPSVDGPGDPPASAVISDGSTPLAADEALPGPGIPLLDFRQWLGQHGHKDGSINTMELRHWLLEALPNHANGPLP
ncbi:MAG: hypothetical protein AAB285_06130, partial [candidate division NC10 bacterium]